MGETVLNDQELVKIGSYIKPLFNEWARESNIISFQPAQPDLLERMVRVEEGLKALADNMDRRFESMEKRFEIIDKRFEAVDKRFESIDKRFEDLLHYMDKRFEATDKRFEDINSRFNHLFTVIALGFGVVTALITIFQFMG